MENVMVPKSLVEMVRYFSDPDVCIEFVAAMRWVDGIAQCPHCGKSNAGFLKTRRIWKCRECRKQFSVKTDSIFEESPHRPRQVALRDLAGSELQERYQQL